MLIEHVCRSSMVSQHLYFTWMLFLLSTGVPREDGVVNEACVTVDVLFAFVPPWLEMVNSALVFQIYYSLAGGRRGFPFELRFLIGMAIRVRLQPIGAYTKCFVKSSIDEVGLIWTLFS